MTNNETQIERKIIKCHVLYYKKSFRGAWANKTGANHVLAPLKNKFEILNRFHVKEPVSICRIQK